MPYPEYTKADLAAFSGRPEASYPSTFTTTALSQAVLLFKMGTCLASLDDLTEDELLLAKMGILSMADGIVLAQPYAAAGVNPFNSESIGSYSYSKTAGAVALGVSTGIGWFDMAIAQLSVCEANDGIPSGGGIEIFEHQGTFVSGAHKDNVRFLGPDDISQSREYGYDPAPSATYGG